MQYKTEIRNSKKMISSVIVVAIFLLVYYGVTTYRAHKQNILLNPNVITTVTPKVTTLQSPNTKQKTEVNLSFTLTPVVPMAVSSAYLETLSTSTIPSKQVTLTKQVNGTYTGSLVVPSEWLNKAQTVSFVLYLNNIKTLQIVRFAITDIPLKLPLDPGEAGKATLAGVDSDNDGVRDDLQREIVFLHPENDTLRRVLRAMVKKEQDVITTEGDHEHFKGLEISFLSLLDCYNHLVFGENLVDHTKSNILISLIRNTPERLKIDRQNSYTSLPYAVEVGSAQACENVSGRY